jgi:hypothetical protein
MQRSLIRLQRPRVELSAVVTPKILLSQNFHAVFQQRELAAVLRLESALPWVNSDQARCSGAVLMVTGAQG